MPFVDIYKVDRLILCVDLTANTAFTSNLSDRVRIIGAILPLTLRIHRTPSQRTPAQTPRTPDKGSPRDNAVLQTLLHGNEEGNESRDEEATGREQALLPRLRHIQTPGGIALDFEQVLGHSRRYRCHGRRLICRPQRAAVHSGTHQAGARARESAPERALEACGGDLEVEVDDHSDCGVVWVWRRGFVKGMQKLSGWFGLDMGVL